MSKKFFLQCIVAASLTFAACGDDSDDGGDDTQDAGGGGGNDAGVNVDAGGGSSDAGAGGACGTVTYANYGKALLDQHCIVCHGATPAGNEVKLNTIEAVRAKKGDIIDHAVEPRKEPKMPLGLPAIPAADQAKLKAWLDCNAP